MHDISGILGVFMAGLVTGVWVLVGLDALADRPPSDVLSRDP